MLGHYKAILHEAMIELRLEELYHASFKLLPDNSAQITMNVIGKETKFSIEPNESAKQVAFGLSALKPTDYSLVRGKTERALIFSPQWEIMKIRATDKKEFQKTQKKFVVLIYDKSSTQHIYVNPEQSLVDYHDTISICIGSYSKGAKEHGLFAQNLNYLIAKYRQLSIISITRASSDAAKVIISNRGYKVLQYMYYATPDNEIDEYFEKLSRGVSSLEKTPNDVEWGVSQVSVVMKPLDKIAPDELVISGTTSVNAYIIMGTVKHWYKKGDEYRILFHEFEGKQSPQLRIEADEPPLLTVISSIISVE